MPGTPLNYLGKPHSFWRGFINPTQEDIEAVYAKIGVRYLNKRRMFRDFDYSPKNAWMYLVIDHRHFDLYYIYDHHVPYSNIPPKSFIKHLLDRLKRIGGSGRPRPCGRASEELSELLKNHPWDTTQLEDIHKLDLEAIVARENAEYNKQLAKREFLEPIRRNIGALASERTELKRKIRELSLEISRQESHLNVMSRQFDRDNSIENGGTITKVAKKN